MDTAKTFRIAAIYEAAVEILEDRFGVEPEFRPDYSGRGMFGTSVPGIVADMGDGPAIGAAVAIAIMRDGGSADDVLGAIPTRSDNMGRRVIFY